MPATATVQVRQTTTTTTSRASVLVLNTGYFTTKLGLLKLILLILSLICFILILLETGANYPNNHRYYHVVSPVMFVLLVCFANWYAITLMLIAAILSLGTASLLPKTSFDFVFHFIGCVLFLIAGLWLAVYAFDEYQQRTLKLKSSSILAIVCGILHLVHGIFSYRLCITN